jgi:hypothetical protein
MGLDVEPVRGGCCGLAGSWGFESGHHGLSMQCGDEALLPRVRDADSSTIVVADGFSCRTQIADAQVGRRGLHLAQVMQLARRGVTLDGSAPPESHAMPPPQPSARRRAARFGMVAGAAGGAALSAVAASRSRR